VGISFVAIMIIITYHHHHVVMIIMFHSFLLNHPLSNQPSSVQSPTNQDYVLITSSFVKIVSSARFPTTSLSPGGWLGNVRALINKNNRGFLQRLLLSH